MSASDKVFAGSMPAAYDTWLVPLIFEDFAADLARRVVDGDPVRILETAAGSGVVPRALAPRLRADASYTITDLNQPMLDWAASRQPVDHRLAWQQADALDLPFADGSFDVVCCQFGVMFYPDRVAGYREARRVLKQGGRFLFNTWDRIQANDLPRDITAVLAAMFPEDPPQFLARTPHGYHDTAKIEADVRASGFGDVAIETLARESRAARARDPALAYCQGTPLRAEIEARAPGRLEQVTDQVAAILATLHGEGPVSGRIQAHVVVARRS
ncbi:class I SAM-dependent methyltransferase [Geminicoccus roseus]|uniref:class I SAM-dependent methyltransferase n=1 Tax=Geminicoccus roseus TaxID=404900 RepID=UPI00040B77DC|nr:methyltransferase domain-containing protein [Geminicoccus roseus]